MNGLKTLDIIKKMNNIGLLIIATNKYVSFLQNLLESADKFFLKKQNVTYFIFTDKEDMSFLNTKRNFVITKINHKPWPLMTLHRYKFFKNIKNISGYDLLKDYSKNKNIDNNESYCDQTKTRNTARHKKLG